MPDEPDLTFEQTSLFGTNAPLIESTETLADINREIAERARLHPEIKDRTLLFGEGETNVKLALVGESPSPPDVNSGHLFTGPSGDLLDRILSAIGLVRRNLYITNTIKMVCSGDEITPAVLSFFTPYLRREIAVVRPRIIIASGNTPAKALLNTKKGITQIRGEFHNYNGAQLMPMFNPAYLLRDPTKKREVWEDMKKVRDLYHSLKD